MWYPTLQGHCLASNVSVVSPQRLAFDGLLQSLFQVKNVLLE